MTDRQRLKADGTPDRRGGKLGNRGNRQATGRKRIAGQETRKNMMIYASNSEWELMRRFCHLLKSDADTAQQVLDSLGTPPDAAKKPPRRERKQHGIRVLASEKNAVKIMLLLVRDRIAAARLALDEVDK